MDIYSQKTLVFDGNRKLTISVNENAEMELDDTVDGLWDHVLSEFEEDLFYDFLKIAPYNMSNKQIGELWEQLWDIEEEHNHVCIDQWVDRGVDALENIKSLWENYELKCNSVKNVETTAGINLVQICSEAENLLDQLVELIEGADL